MSRLVNWYWPNLLAFLMNNWFTFDALWKAVWKNVKKKQILCRQPDLRRARETNCMSTLCHFRKCGRSNLGWSKFKRNHLSDYRRITHKYPNQINKLKTWIFANLLIAYALVGLFIGRAVAKEPQKLTNSQYIDQIRHHLSPHLCSFSGISNLTIFWCVQRESVHFNR